MKSTQTQKLEGVKGVQPGDESVSMGEAGESGRPGLETLLAYILVALAALTLGLILGLNGRPELSSYMVVGGIIAYLISSITYHKARWVPLMLTLGLHIGAITSYYSNPIVLPLLIIERWGEKSVINLDIVQLIIAYEILTASTSRIRQSLKT